MIKFNLLKLVFVCLFVWTFHNEIVCRIECNIFGTAKKDCIIKTRETIIFLPLINNSVTTGLGFLLRSIS